MEITIKKKYIAPNIEIIFLDNEISLALQSSPPEGPDEVYLRNKQSSAVDNVFKT